MYISDGIVVISNEIEKKTFLFDKREIITYQINQDLFELLEFINQHPHQPIESLDNYFDGINDVVSFLLSNKIITDEVQSLDYKIKRIDSLNTARVFIECTSKCNLFCPHCYGAFGCGKTTSLDLDILRKFIQSCATIGVYEVDITGGEPMLYPDFEGLLECLYSYGMITNLFTNLTVCTSEQVDLLVKYGIKCVITSIESYKPAVHDKFRGLQGALDRTVDNIRRIKEAGIEVKVNFVLGNHNLSEAEDTIDFICGLGVPCNIDITTPEGRAEGSSLDLPQAISILRKYNDNAIVDNCGVGRRMIFVSSDGNILPCPSIRRSEYILGNLYATYDIIECYKKVFSLFGQWKCNTHCGNKNCQGGCRARALKFHNTLFSADDYYCYIFEEKSI